LVFPRLNSCFFRYSKPAPPSFFARLSPRRADCRFPMVRNLGRVWDFDFPPPRFVLSSVCGQHRRGRKPSLALFLRVLLENIVLGRRSAGPVVFPLWFYTPLLFRHWRDSVLPPKTQGETSFRRSRAFFLIQLPAPSRDSSISLSLLGTRPLPWFPEECRIVFCGGGLRGRSSFFLHFLPAQTFPLFPSRRLRRRLNSTGFFGFPSRSDFFLRDCLKISKALEPSRFPNSALGLPFGQIIFSPQFGCCCGLRLRPVEQLCVFRRFMMFFPRCRSFRKPASIFPPLPPFFALFF